MRYLIFILLLVGCESYEPVNAPSVEPVLKANVGIRSEADEVDRVVDKAIETKDTSELVQVKPRTDKIRSKTIEVDSIIFDVKRYIEEDAKRDAKRDRRLDELEKKTNFRTYLPWTILGLGIIIALLGRFMFHSIGATIGGGLMAFLSIVIHQYYDAIAKLGAIFLMLLVFYLVGMFIVKHEQIKKKAIDIIRDDDIND